MASGKLRKSWYLDINNKTPSFDGEFEVVVVEIVERNHLFVLVKFLF